MAESFTCIVKDIRGAEGPVFDKHGRFFMVAPGLGQVLEVNLEEGTTREHVNTGGVPAGLQVDEDNAIWVADMKLGLLRIDENARLEVMIPEFEGKPMRGCNDCSLDREGNLYITAPAGSSADNPTGEVFCRLADGRVARLDQGYAFSNGLAVNADATVLVVAETMTRKLWAYDIVEPGVVENKRLFATMSGSARTGADGMDYDVEGNLLATNHGEGVIDVFDPEGKLVESIQLPFGKPSNLHFGGADGKDLYITEHDSYGLWKTRWRHAGLQVFGR